MRASTPCHAHSRARLVSASNISTLIAILGKFAGTYPQCRGQFILPNVQVIEETAVLQELGQDVHVIRYQTHAKQLHDIGMTQLATEIGVINKRCIIILNRTSTC